MAELRPLVVPIRVRVKGMWRIVLLGWAYRLFGLGPAHVQVVTKT